MDVSRCARDRPPGISNQRHIAKGSQSNRSLRTHTRRSRDKSAWEHVGDHPNKVGFLSNQCHHTQLRPGTHPLGPNDCSIADHRTHLARNSLEHKIDHWAPCRIHHNTHSPINKTHLRGLGHNISASGRAGLAAGFACCGSGAGLAIWGPGRRAAKEVGGTTPHTVPATEGGTTPHTVQKQDRSGRNHWKGRSPGRRRGLG